VIAALRFERKVITNGGAELSGANAGGHHGGVAGDLAPVGDDGFETTIIYVEARSLR
jgi:hypothetical protein